MKPLRDGGSGLRLTGASYACDVNRTKNHGINLRWRAAEFYEVKPLRDGGSGLRLTGASYACGVNRTKNHRVNLRAAET